MPPSIPSILVIFAAAALAPLLAELLRRFGVSVVVLEILLGVMLGPQCLGWADPAHGAVPYLSLFGMGFLFFIAGVEIDLGALASELRSAVVAWLAAFVVAVAVALGLASAGLIDAWLVVAIALTTTALGVLVPILKDAAILDTSFGRQVMAVAVLGELCPILAMSIALSTHHPTTVQLTFTALFLAVVAFVYWASTHLLSGPVMRFLRNTMTRSGQLPVRLSVLLLVTLAVLAEELGIDLALGALAAGMVVGLALREAVDHTMHHKLEALSFGFVVPIFFISSGMKLDVASIFSSGRGLMLLAISFVALLAVRVPAMLLYRSRMGTRPAMAHGLLSATTLSLIVAITGIAVAGGSMKPSEAAPLVAAGMLSVLLFPAFALPLAGVAAGRTPESTRAEAGGT